MTSKKIISAIMAGACALSMTSIAAFAADPVTTDIDAAGEKTYDVNAGYTAPVIDVTVPTALNAVINPYQIAIDLSAAKDGSLMTGTDGIASPEYSIKNNSATFGIKVGAKLSAKGTGITVAATPDKIPTKLDSEKAAFTFLNTTTGEDGDTVGTYAKDAYDAAEKTQLAFTEEKPERATVIMTLEEKAAGKKSQGFFKVQGQVTDPEIVEKKYATTDKLALSIVFDINPYNPAAGGVNPPATTNASPLTALSFANGALGSFSFTETNFTTKTALTGAISGAAGGTLVFTPTFTAGTDTATMTVKSGGTAAGAITSGTSATITGVAVGTDLVFEIVTTPAGGGTGTTYTVTFTVAA